MILYVVANTSDLSVTAPAIASDLPEVQLALKTINPENIDSLHIHILAELNSFSDLFLLEINPNKSLPDFLFNRSPEVTPSGTHQGEAAVVDYDTRS